jgi:hypothetical protein
MNILENSMIAPSDDLKSYDACCTRDSHHYVELYAQISKSTENLPLFDVPGKTGKP